jgi:hypothetical protein
MFYGKVIGGLGNQMFQVSFYNYLSKVLDMNFIIDISDFDNCQLHNGFELTKIFNLKLLSTKKPMHATKAPLIHKIQRKIFDTNFIVGKNHFFEQDIEFILNSKVGEFYIEGYFQNYLYVEKNFFNFSRIDLKKFECDLFNLNNDSDSQKKQLVSIHIRGGDFLNLKNKNLYNNICNKQYYKSAIKHFKGSDYHFLIFTDDKKYAFEILPEIDFTVVDWNYGSQSYRDLYLMSLCDHHIISNSTFSWWGAYLTKNNGSVITPSRWNNINNGLFDNVSPPSWIKI